VRGFFRSLREMGWRKSFESRPCEEVALEEPDILVGEPAILGECFDSLSDHVDVEFKASQTNGAHDGLAGTWALDAADEPHVEFDLVRLQVAENIKIGPGCAKVVDGEAQSELSIFLEQACEMSTVLDEFGLRSFEDNATDWQTGFMSGFQSSEQRLWIGSKTLRQKVQVQRTVDAETSGKRDGCCARGLIEKVETQRRNLIENLPCRLIPHPANESFPGDDFSRDRVDNGLKGEAEGRFGWSVRAGAHRAPASWIGDDIVTMAHRAW
jgi:hypothetical protein